MIEIGDKRYIVNMQIWTGYKYIVPPVYRKISLYQIPGGYYIDDFDWAGYWWKIGTDIWT